MPYCTNPDCDHRKRLGEPAEFNGGVTVCSDCGSSLSDTVPSFPERQERTGGESWTCPQCGAVNRHDLSLCLCGYDTNRPLNPDMLGFRPVPELDPTSPEFMGRQRELKLLFTGNAQEYFRIWIVNLCLTLLTLGIFSAWAKVRKKRYFYSHTMVDGTPFQYLGRPVPILKGRVIAGIFFLAYYLSSHFFTSLLPAVFIAGSVLAPWVVIRSAAFNARYSAYRNMTFHFDAGYVDALKVLYVWGLAPLFVLGAFLDWWTKKPVIGALLVVGLAVSFPWWLRRFKRFIIEHTSFGSRKGSFIATGGQFFKVYFLAGLIMLGVLMATGLFAALMFSSLQKSQFLLYLVVVPIYAGYALAYAFVQARSSNLVWNNTWLGPLRFRSTLVVSEMVKLYVTNALAIVVSAGLLIPWAVMRTLQYRADHMRVLQEGELTEFEGSDMSAVDAIGAETVDFFDVDISL